MDLTHTVPAQDVRHGAWVLAETTSWFPSGTIHVAVVDPGVGTERKILYARIGTQQYIAPDNGLLSYLAQREEPSTIIELSEPAYRLARISSTFHGRDIMAPAAAHLSMGVEPIRLGPAMRRIFMFDRPEVLQVPGKIQGSVRSVDSFGNLITDITEAMLAETPRDENTAIECDEHETQGIFRTYADQPEMTLMALVGSSGYLELAIVGENASMMLGIGVGARVTVRW